MEYIEYMLEVYMGRSYRSINVQLDRPVNDDFPHVVVTVAVLTTNTHVLTLTITAGRSMRSHLRVHDGGHRGLRWYPHTPRREPVETVPCR